MAKGTSGRSREAARAASQVLWDWLDMDAELAAVPTVADEAPEWKAEALGTGQSLFGTDTAWERRDAVLDSMAMDNSIAHKEGGQHD